MTNRSTLVVSVDRSALQAQADGGKAVLQRLGALLQVAPAELAKRITPCAKGVPRAVLERLAVPAGAGGRPTPRRAIVLTIEERQEDYPGVSAESQTLRQYPNGSLAAHSLGYVGPVNQDELDAARKAGRTDLNLNAQIGRAGLEKTYDGDLRGKRRRAVRARSTTAAR